MAWNTGATGAPGGVTGSAGSVRSTIRHPSSPASNVLTTAPDAAPQQAAKVNVDTALTRDIRNFMRRPFHNRGDRWRADALIEADPWRPDNESRSRSAAIPRCDSLPAYHE
jgi:hypothetical protein